MNKKLELQKLEQILKDSTDDYTRASVRKYTDMRNKIDEELEIERGKRLAAIQTKIDAELDEYLSIVRKKYDECLADIELRYQKWEPKSPAIIQVIDVEPELEEHTNRFYRLASYMSEFTDAKRPSIEFDSTDQKGMMSVSVTFYADARDVMDLENKIQNGVVVL